MAILIKKKEKLDRTFFFVPWGTEWSLVGIPQAFKDVVELGFTQFLSWNDCLYQDWQRHSEPDTSPSFGVSCSQNPPPTSTGSAFGLCTKEAGALCCILASTTVNWNIKHHVLFLEKLELFKCCVHLFVPHLVLTDVAADINHTVITEN